MLALDWQYWLVSGFVGRSALNSLDSPNYAALSQAIAKIA